MQPAELRAAAEEGPLARVDAIVVAVVPRVSGHLSEVRVGMHDIVEKGVLCPIKGQPPSLINIPQGCAFHPRCPHAKEVCSAEVPELRSIEGKHTAACHFAGDPGFERGEAACAGVTSG